METFMRTLSQSLAFDDRHNSPTVFLAKSRSEGRRILQYMAQNTTLIGVSVETPMSLATAISSKKLSEEHAPKLISNAQGERLFFTLLGEMTEGYYAQKEGAKSLSAARLFFQTYKELRLGLVEKLIAPEDTKPHSTQMLFHAYTEKKRRLNYIDSADLLTLATEEAPNYRELLGAKFLRLEAHDFTPLEEKLLQKISQNSIVTIPMPEEDALHSLETNPCRFISCRGTETEVRFAFRDMLTGDTKLEDCAIVYLENEYKPWLYDTAQRFRIPLTMTSGLPLSTTNLYATLKSLETWSSENHLFKTLYELISSGSCGPKKPTKLLALLSRRDMTEGKNLYTLEEAPEGIDPEIFAQWQDFLSLATILGENNLPLEAQEKNLRKFLSSFTPHHTANTIAPYSATQNLVSTALDCAKELGNFAQGSLLSQLLTLMEDSNYLPSAETNPSLLCLPLESALLSGRSKIYILGMSRYSLDFQGKESPILLDKERLDYPTLPTLVSLSEDRRKAFRHLLGTHKGSIVFTYSNFDSSAMLEDLPPAPFFSDALSHLQGKLEEINYIPEKALSAGDMALLSPENEAPLAFTIEKDKAPSLDPNLKAIIENFPFSATSLETAYACPLKFYLNYILRLRTPRLSPSQTRWLEANVFGTAVHDTLEDYFTILINEGKGDAKKLTEEKVEQLISLYPATNDGTKALRDKEIEELRHCISLAIESYENSGYKAIGAEENFGMDGKDFTIDIGSKKLHIKGSIDRIDLDENTGEHHILDYKTTNPRSFYEEEALHLQHYLYALAFEKLHPDSKVSSAAYQLLRDEGHCVAYEQKESYRKDMARKLEGLLENLCNKDILQTPKPCFVLDKENHLALGTNENRQTAYKSCKNFCDYREFCKTYWEEMTP